MWSFLIELTPPLVKALLLLPHVGARRPGSLAFEGTVHAFVSSVLLWLSGLDTLMRNAELDPPDGELGEATQRDRCKGSSVVGSHGLR